jgi:hypothetical protein
MSSKVDFIELIGECLQFRLQLCITFICARSRLNDERVDPSEMYKEPEEKGVGAFEFEGMVVDMSGKLMKKFTFMVHFIGGFLNTKFQR